MTSAGSGALRATSAGVCDQPSGISAFHRSAGTSIRTGPGRPFLSWAKARRKIAGTLSGVATCSADLVTLRMFRAELKFG